MVSDNHVKWDWMDITVLAVLVVVLAVSVGLSVVAVLELIQDGPK